MLLLAALLSPPPSEARAEGAPLDLSSWVAASLEHLASSPTYQRLQAREASAESFIHASWEQSPWTVRSTATHGQAFPRTGSVFVPQLGSSVPTSRSWELGLTGALEYRRRERLVGTVAGSVGYLDDRERAGVNAGDLPFALDVNLAYDVLRGGAGSSENDRARAAAYLGVADKLETDAARLSARLRFLEQAVALFGNVCKRRQVERLAGVVKGAVESARVQLQSRVLTQAEYLNYQFLENTIAAREASVELERRALLEGLLVWGEAVKERMHARLGLAVDCDGARGSATKWADAAALDADALRRLAERLPAYAASRAANLSATFDLSAAETELLAGLSPFVAGRVARAPGSDEEVLTAQLGLQLAWNVPQVRGAAARDVALFARQAAQRRMEEVYAQQVSAVRTLTARMETERRVLETLVRSAASVDELARVLEVQRAIGEANALNQATALVNAVDLELAMVDGGLRIGLAWHQLQAMQAAAEAVGEQDRLDDADWLE